MTCLLLCTYSELVYQEGLAVLELLLTPLELLLGRLKLNGVFKDVTWSYVRKET